MTMTAKVIPFKQPILRVTQDMDTSDHDLLLLAIAKERSRQAFKEIFSFYAPKIYKYGKSNQLSEAQAQDLVQEVMTIIWTKADKFSTDKGKAITWIFAITRNIKFDLQRKKAREKCVVSSFDIWQFRPESEPIDSETNPERIRENQNLKNLVEKLPVDQRDVILGVYFEGLTHQEYSSKAGVPLGTVKSRIRLAIRRLNQLMEGE